MQLARRQDTTQIMRQEQTMTRYQIQALEILSCPSLALESIIYEEISKNSALDIVTSSSLVSDETNKEDEKWLEKLVHLTENSYFTACHAPRMSKEEEKKRQYYLESIEAKKSLDESLMEQLRFLELSTRMYRCCEILISSLDDQGYLRSHISDLEMIIRERPEFLHRAISIIQNLEPTGIGAKNLQDRLLIQLRKKKCGEDSLAYLAVRDYFFDIAANRFPAIARRMNIPMGQLSRITMEIRSLNPRIDIIENKAILLHSIREEAVILESNGSLQIDMVKDYFPRVFIRHDYKELLANSKTPEDVKIYIKEKVRSGNRFIHSIHQRQTTIRKTIGVIVKKQEEFFLRGIHYLKPLTMAQVAKKVGVHETTISRSVSEKYIRCSFGLFPLRNFFSTGYTLKKGKKISNLSVKTTIKKLIHSEDPYAPFSDRIIAEKLEETGLHIARRTITKYREHLGILPSNLRRKFAL